jgi:uncharacterized membrane protein YdjX (TVP38/TMEM64 family)
MLRIAGGGTVLEAICYGAGLLGVKFKNFLIASVVSHSIVGLPTFYFANNLLEGRNVTITAVSVVVAVLIVYKYRHRYLETGDI